MEQTDQNTELQNHRFFSEQKLFATQNENNEDGAVANVPRSICVARSLQVHCRDWL